MVIEVSNRIGGELVSAIPVGSLGPSLKPILTTGMSVALVCTQAITQSVITIELVFINEAPFDVIVAGADTVQPYSVALSLDEVTLINEYWVSTGDGVGDAEKVQFVV